MSIVVFSRQQDPVRTAPDNMANMLLSNEIYKPFRGKAVKLPDEVDVLSIWTKNPINLLENKNLFKALKIYREEKDIPIELQVSVTGMAFFKFLEYGVSIKPEEIKKCIEKLIDEQILIKEMVKIRIDPIFSVEIYTADDNKAIISNMKLKFIEYLFDVFQDVSNVFLSSHRDIGDYSQSMKEVIEKRSDFLELKVSGDSDEEVNSFFKEIEQLSKNKGVNWGICANPPKDELKHQSCIDIPHYNSVTGTTLKPVLSPSRPGCKCFKGVTSVVMKGNNCYGKDIGCFLCYAQRSKNIGKVGVKMKNDLYEFKKSPGTYINSFPQIYKDMVDFV